MHSSARPADEDEPLAAVGSPAPVRSLLEYEDAEPVAITRSRPSGTRAYLLRAAAGLAAIALIGSGVVVRSYDAHPGDSLWVVAKVVFPEKSRSVEAATVVSTALNTARVALESGRIDEARAAFQTVQAQLAAVDDADGRAELAHQRDYLTTQLGGPAHAAAEQVVAPTAGPPLATGQAGATIPSSPSVTPGATQALLDADVLVLVERPRRPVRRPLGDGIGVRRPLLGRSGRQLGPGRRRRARPRPRCVRTARGQRARPVRCGLRARPRDRRRPRRRRPPTRPPTRPWPRRARSRPHPPRAPADPATPAQSTPEPPVDNGAVRGRRVRQRRQQRRQQRSDNAPAIAPSDPPSGGSDDAAGGSDGSRGQQVVRRLLAELVGQLLRRRLVEWGLVEWGLGQLFRRRLRLLGRRLGLAPPAVVRTAVRRARRAAATADDGQAAGAEISVDGLAGSTLGAVTGVVASTTGA